MAASSRSAITSSARACEACVTTAGSVDSGTAVPWVPVTCAGGSSSFSMNSFMCGVEDVATATTDGSDGQIWTSAGVKATHALECGARFCFPSRLISAALVSGSE